MAERSDAEPDAAPCVPLAVGASGEAETAIPAIAPEILAKDKRYLNLTAAGKGRKVGSKNKATMELRQVIADIADRQAPKVEAWLEKVAEDDPGKALDLFLRMIEYHIPKLARTEMTGEDGGALTIRVTRFDPDVPIVQPEPRLVR